MVKGDWIKPRTVVIDVGINRVESMTIAILWNSSLCAAKLAIVMA